jgi:hypothetical protein
MAIAMSIPDAAARRPNPTSSFSRMHIGRLSDAGILACKITLIKSRIAHPRKSP